MESSCDPGKITLPSLETETDLTDESDPSRVLSKAPLLISRIFIVLSFKPEIIKNDCLRNETEACPRMFLSGKYGSKT